MIAGGMILDCLPAAFIRGQLGGAIARQDQRKLKRDLYGPLKE